jgi:hypothetical protein
MAKATDHLSPERVIVGQPMKNQQEFCIDSILEEFPALARTPSGPSNRLDRRDGERLSRLKRLQIESTRLRAAQIEAMIADLARMANALQDDIQAERDRTGIHDLAHFAYSTSARAMTERRDNLNRSIDELKRHLVDAKVALE